MNIEIRSTITHDVKIAQAALETIGFKTLKEGDAIDAYWVEMTVPEIFAHGKCKVVIGVEGINQKEVELKWGKFEFEDKKEKAE